MEGLSPQRLSRLVRRFADVRLLVVGDLMLDQFVWGNVSRISPEAPVPVVRVTSESFHLGGAANVVSNICALGGRAGIVGVVGTDTHGQTVLRELQRIGADVSGVVRVRELATTRKIRIIAHQQQVVRLDREQRPMTDRLQRRLVRRMQERLADVDGVVVSDYGKGVVQSNILDLLAERGGRRPFLFVDPKRGNFPHYRNATLVKPNLDAAAQASGVDIVDEASLLQAGHRLLELWESESVLLSRGDEGMTLFRREGEVKHIPTAAREVYDVTGAGDTVVATAALAFGAGASFEEAAVLANRAAGIVVGKIGTATVTAEELLAAPRRGGRG